ncbi:expressed unknown protein [Seminavis robusta]|uniref:RNI-like protein n=1 Tax=Seminavis robusta TaxID=568900 RepID=A0A9N8EY34_9STRA|nr:expressed unknown protein [Seminavis robusta]|eukprot:Sro1948_g307200.1 n/a (498) ;mRNA; f:9116-10609
MTSTMKLLQTTLLRRHRSNPMPAADSKASPSNDSMIVDLARNDALPALRVLRETPKLHQSVKTAVIHAESCVWYGSVKMDLFALVEVFSLLGELPRLQSITVDLSDLKVPMAALTALLRGAKALRELHLINIHLVGDTKALDEVLKTHNRLQHVRFLRCTGVAIQSFMAHLPSLKRLELRYSALGERCTTTDVNPWKILGASTTLQSLTIQELADLTTDNALSFCMALSEQQLRGTCQLQELHMTSASTTVDGQQIGQAMADIFILHSNNCTIKTLTLKFGRTWKTAGHTVASILQRNPGLSSLCVELTGGNTATSTHAAPILHALTKNNTLKRLKICLDRDMHLDEPLEDAFQSAIEQVLLQHNHVLQSLVILDENRDRYLLTKDAKLKLELNATKLPALLHSHNGTQRDYLNAMIDANSGNSLDAVFYALSNQPNLLRDMESLEVSAAHPTTMKKQQKSLIDSDSESDDESTRYWGIPIVKRKSKRKTIKDFFKV